MQGKTSKVSVETNAPRRPREDPLDGLKRRLADLDHHEEALRASMDRLFALTTQRSSPLREVRLRTDFVQLAEPATTGSDRRKPDKYPPSIALITSRGSALHFLLIALLAAQCETKPGARPRNPRPLVATSKSEVGWRDLFAPRVKPYGGAGNSFLIESDLKNKQVNRNLDKIQRLALIEYPNMSATRKKREGFILLNEGGRRADGGNDAYTVPKLDENIFELPTAFFTYGWVHVLEETEIALLLVAASKLKHSPGGFRLDAKERVTEYGILPNTYDQHISLQELGLLDVEHGPGRHSDGRIIDYTEESVKIPNLLRFTPDGLEKDAIDARREQFQQKIKELTPSGAGKRKGPPMA